MGEEGLHGTKLHMVLMKHFVGSPEPLKMLLLVPSWGKNDGRNILEVQYCNTPTFYAHLASYSFVGYNIKKHHHNYYYVEHCGS